MNKDGKIMLSTPIISGGVLGGLFTLIFFLENPISEWFPNWVDDIQIGLMLFALWLVVSSAIRTANSVEASFHPLKLILIGILVSILGFVAYSIFLLIYSKSSGIAFRELMVGMQGRSLFFLIVAALISVLVTINLKIKDKFLGNVVEVIVIAGALFLLFKIMH